MIYFIYNYKDVKLKVFDAPIFSTESPEIYSEHVERTLKTIKPFDFQFAKDKALYFFGTFDDVTGKFAISAKKELLLTNEVLPSFESVLNAYKQNPVKDEKNDSVVYRIEFNLERERLRAAELAKEEVKDEQKSIC